MHAWRKEETEMITLENTMLDRLDTGTGHTETMMQDRMHGRHGCSGSEPGSLLAAVEKDDDLYR